MAAKKTTAKRATTKKKAAPKAGKTAAKPAAKKPAKKAVKKSVPRKKAAAKKPVARKKVAAKKKTVPKKKAAAKKPAAKKAVRKAAPKKPAAKKKVAPKKSAAKKKPVAKKKAAPKKAAPKKAAPKKAAPKKKAAARKPAVKKAVKKAAPPKVEAKKPVPEQEVVVRKPAARRKPSRKKALLNDPLAPRPKKRPKKLEVLRPGRKKSNNHTAKPRSFRAFTAKKKEHYRLQLLEIRERISSQISSLKKESLTRADEVNIEEDGTDAFDRQFALNLASSESEALIAIDAALKRIKEGAFGKCEECGGGIETARLKAIPFVENCISCQSEVEKTRPGYRPPITLD